jgi:hypothetical protein
MTRRLTSQRSQQQQKQQQSGGQQLLTHTLAMALLNIALSSNEYSSSDEPLWAAAGLAVELLYSVQGCAGSSSSSSSSQGVSSC